MEKLKNRVSITIRFMLLWTLMYAAFEFASEQLSKDISNKESEVRKTQNLLKASILQYKAYKQKIELLSPKTQSMVQKELNYYKSLLDKLGFDKFTQSVWSKEISAYLERADLLGLEVLKAQNSVYDSKGFDKKGELNICLMGDFPKIIEFLYKIENTPKSVEVENFEFVLRDGLKGIWDKEKYYSLKVVRYGY
ncbi:MAG: hypothetical protein GXO62_02980 [Epsilonproteobacteria bacterium]|nr:hypothetical protein [Campylobacterota bacterium]